MNSVQIIPETITEISTEISRWALLTAIAAVGMKTALREVINVGLPAISLLVIETAFICCFMIAVLYWFF